MEDTSRITESLFARAERLKIVGRLRDDLAIKPNFNATERLATSGNIKINGVSDFGRIGSATSKDVGKYVKVRG